MCSSDLDPAAADPNTVGLVASGSTGVKRTQPARAGAETAMSPSSLRRLTALEGVDIINGTKEKLSEEEPQLLTPLAENQRVKALRNKIRTARDENGKPVSKNKAFAYRDAISGWFVQDEQPGRSDAQSHDSIELFRNQAGSDMKGHGRGTSKYVFSYFFGICLSLPLLAASSAGCGWTRRRRWTTGRCACGSTRWSGA